MQNGYQSHLTVLAGVLVQVEPGQPACPLCQAPMHVQKTLQRQAVTRAHGRFRVREVVYACPDRCEREGSLVTRRSAALSELVPPKSTVGYDILVYVGVERFVGPRQREEIRATLAKEHGIHLSSGEISELGQRFVIYLEALHRNSAPALRAALAAEGGWPLHLDATGEDGRGTRLVALAGWRPWVLGAWKIPTERAEAIQPKLEEVAAQFGPPCAIMRDLGLPPAAALAANLTRSDYVSIVCGGSLDQLPQAFARLDARDRRRSLAARSTSRKSSCEVESASLNAMDRRFVRSKDLERCVLAAAGCHA